LNFDRSLPKRILIVDDEPYNLLGLKIVINAADPLGIVSSIIDEVTNGLEAYKAIKKAQMEGKFEYGLIFMDCSMPIMDGYEATDKIRKFLRTNVSQQPMIVACTGHSENEFIKKAWRYQMDEVVPKPANIEVIKCLLKEIIQYTD
jgi:CheY-like chemotaxis protein